MKNSYSGPRLSAHLLRLVKIGFISLKQGGVAYTWVRTKRVLRSFVGTYKTCRQFSQTPLYSQEQLDQQRADVFDGVTFSIVVPLFNTPEPFLREMLDSVIAQTYSAWELCLADGSDEAADLVRQVCEEYAARDARVKYQRLNTNLGIAGNSNAAIAMAEGEYIAFLDHDDILHPAALHDVASVISERNADFVFTDEAKFLSPNVRDIFIIHFKPGYAPDDLRANNYICHFMVTRASLLRSVGLFRDGFEGSQDHDLVLRLTRQGERIVHIPEVLYYWRAHSKSTAMDVQLKPYASESGKKAVADSLKAEGLPARVVNTPAVPTIYRCMYKLQGRPFVSIVIPSADHVDDLDACLTSIKEKSTYDNYEIIVVENNSRELRTYEYYEDMLCRWPDVKILMWDGPFNWSAINNYAVENAVVGDMVLLLNNDTQVISPDWLQEMIMYAQRPDVGCVGAMLYYPNDTIQHAGAVVGVGGAPMSFRFRNVKRGEVGYWGRLLYAQNMSAVVGACMMMRREVYDQVGGCDELFAVGLNDIDLCMRVRQAGYLVVWTPFAELYHVESKSRGKDNVPDKIARFESEMALFQKRWAAELKAGDPYYNPNLNAWHLMVRRDNKGR